MDALENYRKCYQLLGSGKSRNIEMGRECFLNILALGIMYGMCLLVYSIIGVSLSEPHIDWHNGPRGGECIYQSICHGVAFVVFNVPDN